MSLDPAPTLEPAVPARRRSILLALLWVTAVCVVILFLGGLALVFLVGGADSY